MAFIDTSLELYRAKTAIGNATRKVRELLLAQPLRSLDQLPEWKDFYYSNPNLNQEPVYLRRFAAFREKIDEACRTPLDQAVDGVKSAFARAMDAKRADDVRKAARKAKTESTRKQREEVGLKLPPFATVATFEVILASLSEIEKRLLEFFRVQVKAQVANLPATFRDEDYIEKQAAYYAECCARRFASKLTAKVDEAKPVGSKITSSTCHANLNPYCWSTLTITGVQADGAQFSQVWETKPIFNYSVYKKRFPQWPTRRRVLAVQKIGPVC